MSKLYLFKFHNYSSYFLAYSNVCQHFTNSSGSFSSITFPKPANEIHSERDFDAARKNSVLISVQPNHKIWLAFEKCVTFENQHFVNVNINLFIYIYY
jgi:hypothetical protein